MSAWLALLDEGRNFVESGQPARASRLYSEGLKRFSSDPNAVQWITFNLMQSEILTAGPKVAQSFLPRLAKTALSWPAKLYACELALTAAEPGDPGLDRLRDSVIDIVKSYVKAQLRPDDINIMSCHTIGRRMHRLFPETGGGSLFVVDGEDESWPVMGVWSGTPTLPVAGIACNRWPQTLRGCLENETLPNRPLGFRRVGPAFIARVGDNTVLYDREGHLLDAPYGPAPAFLKTALERLFCQLSAGRRVSGRSLFIGDYFSQALNYCHWVADSLPRIVAATAAGVQFDRIIGPFSETAGFQMDSLRRVLPEGCTYIGFAATDGLVAIDDLCFADNFNLSHVCHPAHGGDSTLLDKLRRTLCGNEVRLPRRRLYVPRRHNRSVLNEADLFQLLTRYDFEIIDTERMTFAEQVITFSEAIAVCGPHGAALTNILFAPTGCRVLEFFPPFGGSISFYRLAGALGHSYGCYIDDISQGLGRDNAEGILNNTSGMIVDLDFVQKWLEGT